MPRRLSWLVVGVLTTLLAASAVSVPAPAAPTALPAPAATIAAARSATDWWYANGGGGTSDASWRWAPYFMGVEELYRTTGDDRYRQWLQSWGERNRWNPTAPASPTSNPDARAAIQVWESVPALGVTADLRPSDAAMAADLALPAKQYWWIDAMFMGLPLWTTWTARTGDQRYRAKGAEFYQFLRTKGVGDYRTGCDDTRLFDPTEGLWWRDCSYVTQRDAQGHKVFWARGNGWVMGALARTLMIMPAGDPQRPVYAAMLQQMAARVAALQPADGLWRSSLLSPSLFPTPETSGTALFAYAIASGVRSGVLDRATYEPVLQKAWAGLSTVSLQPSGFLSNCQGVGEAPGRPSTTTSIAYCVGAFTLAATEIARLDGTPSTLGADTFDRTVGTGWGAAVTGGPWTTSPAGFSVASGTGRISTPSGQTRTALLAAVDSDRTDLTATIRYARPTRGKVYTALLARRVGTAEYVARTIVGPDGSVRLQLQCSGVTLVDRTVSGLTFGATDGLRLRVQAVGTSPTILRARVWRAGGVEPTTWAVTVSDATAGLQRSGAVGVGNYLGSGSAPTTVTVAVDDLAATRPG